MMVLVASALVIGVVASRPVPKVQAQVTSCSNSVLMGNYGGYFFGSLGGGTVNSVLALHFDGVNNYQMDQWQMAKGVLIINGGHGSGTYSLANLSDGACKGSLTDSRGRRVAARHG